MKKYKIYETELDEYGCCNHMGFERAFNNLEEAKKAFGQINRSNESIKYCYCYTLIVEDEEEGEEALLEEKYFIDDLELALNDIDTSGRINNYVKLYNKLKKEEE